MKEIAILGSTGSIGTQALEVIRLHPDLFHAQVLAAHGNVELLLKQAHEFNPSAIVITDKLKSISAMGRWKKPPYAMTST